MYINLFPLLILPILISTCTQGYCATYQNGLCVSCVNNAYKDGFCCYSCSQCASANMCSSCSKSQLNYSIAAIGLITFGAIVGVTILCTLIRLICRQCNPPLQPNSQSSNRVNQSFNRLSIPSRPIISQQWKKSQKKIIRSQQCAICLEDNIDTLTNCRHSYHLYCIYVWCTKRQQSCPLCKNHQIEPLEFFCIKCQKNSRQLLISQGQNNEQKLCKQCCQGIQPIQSGQIILQQNE